MKVASRNVALLTASQALLFTNNVILIAINGLAGFALAPSPALATLPVTGYVVGAALSTYPMSMYMRRAGRRAGFTAGAVAGMAGAALCALAVWIGAFWLLCLGTLIAGVYNAAGAYYRFAAADTASAEYKSRAISLVMAGGIVGGVIGPETSKLTRELLPVTYLGTYLSLIAFALAAIAILRWVDIPRLSEHERDDSGRPLAAIMAQPVFVVAVISAMVGYGVMNLLMTATPIAMTHHHHHHYNDAAFVLEWHVIGMFLPSFFTGSLIRRFGVLQVMLAGALLMFLCIAFALSGTGLANFWVALVLLGVGWNFLFIGGTTLLTEAYTPPEKAKTQGINDLLVFLTMATSSFSSGALVTSTGWDALNWWSLPFLVVTTLATLWLLTQRRIAPTPQVGA